MAKAYAAYVDELGELKSMISRLCDRETQLKTLLIKSGLDEIDGDFYRATVSTFNKETVVAELVRSILNDDELAEVTRIVSVTSVRVVARTR